MRFARILSKRATWTGAAISFLIWAAPACTSAPKLPQTIDEVCPLDDDEACPPATDSETAEFLKRYAK